jgi:hypothetical protein
MLLYHVAYYLPKLPGERLIRAEALDFPGVASEGFDLSETRRTITRNLENAVTTHDSASRRLPNPDPAADSPLADFVEIIPVLRNRG